MAIGIRSETTGGTTTNATNGTFSVTKPADVQNGDLLVVIIGKQDDPAVAAPDGTWTLGDDGGTATGNDVYGAIFYKRITNAAGEPSSYTFDSLAASMVSGVDIYSLVAIPFFMLAGELMNVSGITQHLAKFARFVVGQIRGGLAYVVVIVNVIMAGVSGSAGADASAVCSVLLPAMDKEGYDRKFAAAINSAASVIGPIIPPSIPMVFIAVISDLSIGRLFLGGVVPGLLMGIFLAVTIYLYSLRHALPVTEVRGGLSEFIRLLGEAFLALLAPVIILAGVVFGVVTIVEVAFLAVLYVLLVGMLAYRTIRFRALPGIFSRAAATSVTILASFASVGA